MVFASGSFMFIFLPVTLIGYLLIIWLFKNRNAERIVKWRNIFLLLMSIFFYLSSGTRQMLLLAMSILVNYIAALVIVKLDKWKKIFLFLAIVYNIGMLFAFKYLGFVSAELHKLLPGYVSMLNIVLPLGISFYTFQAMSYVIDVYRNSDLVDYNPLNVALYISFFPQLIAGPIVRWESVRNDIKMCKTNWGEWNAGIRRFVFGLSKKVIIANNMGIVADRAFELLAVNNLTTAFAWLGAIGYALQIYFDFSGYSDMAIGLGMIFGFHFPENFNYPYISSSITEFWRRWHISLSSWFRDYVYIPLGGNRCSTIRMYGNLLAVWMLTGIWHGANYTFWLWGLLYFGLLMIEKAVGEKVSKKRMNIISETGKIKAFLTKGLKHIYTLLSVLLLWIIFRADCITDACNYILHMFTRYTVDEYGLGVTRLYYRNMLGFFIIGMIACIPWRKVKAVAYIQNMISDKNKDFICQAVTIVLFIISCCVTIDSGYNPFVYFDF